MEEMRYEHEFQFRGFASKLKNFIAVGAVCLIIGLASGAIIALNLRHQRDQVRISNIKNKDALAALLACKCDFDGPRENASSFFDELRQQSESNDDGIPKNQRDGFRKILGNRDETISRLAKYRQHSLAAHQ